MAVDFINPSVAVTSAATRTTIHTGAGATKTVVFSLHLANTDSNNHRITLEIDVGGLGTTFRVLGKDILIPNENTLSWDGKIVLQPGDLLVVTCPDANVIEATSHVMELT